MTESRQHEIKAEKDQAQHSHFDFRMESAVPPENGAPGSHSERMLSETMERLPRNTNLSGISLASLEINGVNHEPKTGDRGTKRENRQSEAPEISGKEALDENVDYLVSIVAENGNFGTGPDRQNFANAFYQAHANKHFHDLLKATDDQLARFAKDGAQYSLSVQENAKVYDGKGWIVSLNKDAVVDKALEPVNQFQDEDPLIIAKAANFISEVIGDNNGFGWRSSRDTVRYYLVTANQQGKLNDLVGQVNKLLNSNSTDESRYNLVAEHQPPSNGSDIPQLAFSLHNFRSVDQLEFKY